MGSVFQRQPLALSLALVANLAGGCARYEARPIDHARGAQFGQRTLNDPYLGEFVKHFSRVQPKDWPPSSWGLSELTLAALYFHPDLDVARASFRVATAREKAAGYYPNPSLDVSAGYDTTTRTPSPWIVTSFLSVAIETGGKRAARRDQAIAAREIARLEIASVAWAVRSRVRSRLESLRSAETAQDLLEAQLALHDENARRIGQRYAAGAVSAFEQMQARLAAQQSRLAVRDAERGTLEARVRLAVAIGIAPEALEGSPLSFDELDVAIPESTLADARARALMNRADLLSALADYAAKEAALRLEIAKQYPDFSIGLGYEYDQGDNKWSLGLLSVRLPLFHRNRGPIAEAEARREESAARFDAMQLRVLEQVATAKVAYESAKVKKEDTAAIKADAEAQLRRAEAVRAAGDISEADVVAVRLELNAASVADSSATSELHRAQGALEDAVQRPLVDDPDAWQSSPRRSAEGDD